MDSYLFVNVDGCKSIGICVPPFPPPSPLPQHRAADLSSKEIEIGNLF